MPKINQLDDTTGAIRLLLTLYKVNQTLNTQQLKKKMKELYDVGRYASESAIQVCGSLKLIEIKKGTEKPKPATYHSLTEKGRKIAEELANLERMLEEG